MSEKQHKAERAFREFLREFAAEIAAADHIEITLDATGDPAETALESRSVKVSRNNPICHPRIDLTAAFLHPVAPDPAPRVAKPGGG
jgi:hypothetical protein